MTTTIRLRPTFSIPTELASSEVFARIRRITVEQASQIEGQFTSRHAMLSIARANRHFWSPWLHIEIREGEVAKEIFGRFSPHPSIWTAFMFSYLVLATLILFSAMFGLSQQLAGESAWAYLLVPVWIAIALVLWIASQFGQKLAADQMKELKALVDECLTSGSDSYPSTDVSPRISSE